MTEENTTGSKRIPMRELEKLTSLTRATINFYIKEGLLPKPHKSAKNMAYYDEEFIEKLKLIEEMRNADFTLTQIKKLIHFDAKTVNDFGMQILESVNKLLPYEIGQTPITIAQIEEIGFTEDYIRQLIELNILLPINSENTLFAPYSITVCRFVKYFLDIGIPLSVARDMLFKLRELADIEKNAFVNYIRNPMVEGNLSKEDQKKVVEKCIENINSLLPILHLQLIKQPNESIKKHLDELSFPGK